MASLSGVVCPPSGTVVTFTRGRDQWLGTDPADPGICLIRRSSDGATVRRLGNLYTIPHAEEASIRRGIAPLFPLAAGKTANFRFQSSPTGAAAGTSRTDTYDVTWRVSGERDVVLETGNRRAWVVVEEQRNLMGAMRPTVFTRLVDKETGALLGTEVDRPLGVVGSVGPLTATRFAPAPASGGRAP